MKQKSKIYTASNAHLDTSWLWTLEQSIEDFIPDTLKRNFEFIEKYPEYKFNFEGSYRYELIKEYYPEEFEKLKKYVAEGRWNPCGACYENGDVNIPSPEALTRNILYGNGFFREEFSTESNDIFLPDCFGFGKALPQVAAHSGVTGFSTGKLFWGSSVDVPFDIGRWMGADGSGVWAALMPFSYTTIFRKLPKAHRVLEKLEKSKEKNLPPITFVYHGNGDRGGAPHKSSVKNIVTAQRNNKNSGTEVYSATTKEFFDTLEAMPDDEKAKMPVYDGELLLTAHGTGSYTARTVTKRWNRRCELLWDAAERFSAAAYINGFAPYPQYGLDSGIKKVIAHHFHDDITGTSFEECYKRSHNDYVQAMNTFSAEYTAACKAIAENLDTAFVTGIPVAVSNPVQGVSSRKGAVSVAVKSDKEYFSVFDKDGNEVPSQTRSLPDGRKEITFIADVPSCGIAVFDLREGKECEIKSDLTVTEKSLENKYLAVKIDENGDICSVFDKTLGRELIKSPVRLGIYNNIHSLEWPAWEVKYKDLCGTPYMYAGSPEIRIRDKGPALCSLEITKTAGKSRFTQIISLDSESGYVSVYNETDWREEASLLKAEFSFTAENEYANYDTGIGYVQRGTNTEKLCEVPAQKWADITDKGGEYGVSVFSDSRQGWDKPHLSTLRLTLIHTPMNNYRHECSQHVMDMGLNRYSFAIKGHSGSPENMTACADEFCQPMHTFITEKNAGTRGREYSFANLNNDKARITALKKAQNSDGIILRVAECSGIEQKGVEASFSLPVEKAFEIRGDEQAPRPVEVTDGKLVFDMGHNQIRSFALVFFKKETDKKSVSIPLNFNAVGITSDKNRRASTLKGGVSLPREITPKKFIFSGVEYEFSADEKNCLVCDGGEITLDGEYKILHLLVASLGGDKSVNIGGADVTVPDCFEAQGLWDLMMLGETGYIKPLPQAITLSHTHSPEGNLTAKQFYLFSVKIPLDGRKSVTLPRDENIVIFSASAVKEDTLFEKGGAHFDELSKREFDYEFSDYALKHMKPNALERVLDKFLDRNFVLNMRTGEFYNKYSLSDLYFIFRTARDRLFHKKDAQRVIESRNKK